MLADAVEVHFDEKTFRFEHNQDAMAVDKLSDGIRVFYRDSRMLEDYAKSLLAKTGVT